MSKKDRKRLEKKRRAERRRAAKRAQRFQVQPYYGNKYSTEELVLALFRAEVGIHEADVLTEGAMTDHHVASALRRFVEALRFDKLEPLSADSDYRAVCKGPEDLIIWSIRRNWDDLLRHGDVDLGRDDMIGILRTILGSVESWKSLDPRSRGYLEVVSEWMDRFGVDVCMVKSERY